MKKLKTICTAATLALALSVSSFGGEITTPGLTGNISTPGVTQPEPKPSDISSPGATLTEPGDVSTPGLTAILLTLAALF
ncbi:MAG: hypothetical protein AABN95_13360 [Acidobacteriota bacterium]